MTDTLPGRRYHRPARATMALLALLSLASCSQPPQESVDQVRQALLDAEAAQAELYAPDALAGARAAATRMQKELDRQSTRAAPLRRYDDTRRLAQDALTAARDARTESELGRDALRAQLEPELPALADAIPAARALLEGALKVRGVTLDAPGLDAEIQAIEVLVTDARLAFDTGRFADASSMSIEAKQRLDTVQKTVQGALDTARGRTR